MLHLFNKSSLFHPAARWALALGAFSTLLLLAGCPGPSHATPAIPTDSADAPVRWHVYAARRQTTYLRLDLPVIVAGTTLTIDPTIARSNPSHTAAAPMPIGSSLLDQTMAQIAASQPALRSTEPAPASQPDTGNSALPWSTPLNTCFSLFTTRVIRSTIEGPQVEQLTGEPRFPADAGSYLVPIPAQPAASAIGKGDALSYLVSDPFPLYLKISVPPGMEPGEYRFTIHIIPPAAPGRASSPQAPAETAVLVLDLADITLPTDPRVYALATTTTAALAHMYPETFDAITAAYLDRADPDQKPAINQLDALVKAAHDQGLALFVEDLAPAVRVDELGAVSLDWDAYDRTMQPYMDGTAFDDRIPMPVWLAPVPPRRIRDSATQLWQYIDACARHFAGKNWVATPAFLHPSLVEDTLAAGDTESPQHQSQLAALRARIAEMMRLHMPREMLAVTTPDAAGWEGVGRGGPGEGADPTSPAAQPAALPHGQLWTVDDSDPRLPPAGPLASEFSVRAWPWVCLARGLPRPGGSNSPAGVKGFVWRDAIAAAGDLQPQSPRRPLFVILSNSASPTAIVPSLRLSWLNEGLTDAALLGVLQQRAQPELIDEVLAGMVGRTGATTPPTSDTRPGLPSNPALPLAPAGYLYAAWPSSRAAWSQVTPTLQSLILASSPGAATPMRPDDPLYLAAQLWLSQTRRPVARVSGYAFALRPGRESDIIDARVRLLVENPVDAPADMDLRFTSLPGDFEMPPETAPPATPTQSPAPEGSIRRRSITLSPAAAALVSLPLAGHVNDLMQSPPPSSIELTEHHAGAALRLPLTLPIYRTHAIDADTLAGVTAPKLDGNPDDWPMDAQTVAYGQMAIATRYLSRPDLLTPSPPASNAVGEPATVRWLYDKNYLYLLARCPQTSLTDERNTSWPVVRTGTPGAGENVRWWGSDGLQIELAGVPASNGPQFDLADPSTASADRIVKIAFKPAGIVLIQTGQLRRDSRGTAAITWRDGPPPPPPAPGSFPPELKYGITIQKQDGRPSSYTIEAAIPRAWIDGPPIQGARAPAWRLNVLRHRALDLTSTSWSGPLADDNDTAMMGLLLGQ